MDLKTKIISLGIEYGFTILKALVILLIGFWVIKMIVKFIDKIILKSVIDISLHSFIKSLVNIGLKVLLVIGITTMLGIPTTTFITVLGAAGLAVGLALKDSLTNFASGILILVQRPFNVGDFIQIEGYAGTVKEIHLLYTNIISADNKKIIIPNSDLTNSKIINLSSEQTRRVDMIFSIGYSEDILVVKEMLNNIVLNHPLIIENPETVVRVSKHDESSIVFDVKVWCLYQDYWTVYYDLHEEVKIAFDTKGIKIPFPQMDVHLVK